MRNIFLISVLLVLAFPATIGAQTLAIHKFAGTVTIDGERPERAIVTAFIEGNDVASAKVVRGRFALSVIQPSGMRFSGKIISFKVDGNPVKSTRRWEEGGSGTVDFSVKTAPALTSTPRPWVKPILTPTPRLRVKPIPTSTPRLKVKPTLEPTNRPWARPGITPKPDPRLTPVKIAPEPTARPALKPLPVPKGNADQERVCFDVKKYHSAPSDEGTIIRTLDRVPVSGGDAVSLTGTTHYDGDSRVLRVFKDDGLWGYLIPQRWKGVPPTRKDGPARVCVISDTTQNNLPDSTPEISPRPPSRTGIDLAVFINSGSDREKVDLVCSGISSRSDESEVRCQVLDPGNAADARARSGPGQWPIIVKNNGGASASDYIVDIVLSSDLIAPVQYAAPLGPVISEDVLIEPGRLDNGPPLGTNSSAVVHVGIGPLPLGIRPGRYGLCAVVDPGNLLLESDEKNNVFCLPVEIYESSNDESGFSGTVLIDGNPATAGTVIASYIKGERIIESDVTDGIYSLIIEQPQEVSFEDEIVEFRLFIPNSTGSESKGILLSQTGIWEAGNIEDIDFEVAQKRGFLINPPIGDIGSSLPWNNIDTNTLSIVGIILTLITAGIPLFKGD